MHHNQESVLDQIPVGCASLLAVSKNANLVVLPGLIITEWLNKKQGTEGAYFREDGIKKHLFRGRNLLIQ